MHLYSIERWALALLPILLSRLHTTTGPKTHSLVPTMVYVVSMPHAILWLKHS